MKKISKSISKKKFYKSKKNSTLFAKDTISLDDQKNKKYLDNIAYQNYLKNESCDFDEE